MGVYLFLSLPFIVALLADVWWKDQPFVFEEEVQKSIL